MKYQYQSDVKRCILEATFNSLLRFKNDVTGVSLPA